jgi:hypothetical protein
MTGGSIQLSGGSKSSCGATTCCCAGGERNLGRRWREQHDQTARREKLIHAFWKVVKRIAFDEPTITKRVIELGKEITAAYPTAIFSCWVC